jgi:hypothetical protein
MSRKMLMAITILSLFIFGCGPNYEKETIKDVVEDVKISLVGFNTDNVSSIGRSIKSNINVMNKLTKRINKEKNYEKAFPYIVQSVDQMAKNYKYISDRKEKINRTLHKRVNQIRKQRQMAYGKIAFVRRKIARTEMELAAERIDYRKIALKSTLKFQKQELEVWEKFAYGMQFDLLINKLDDASGGINKFVDILDANSMVYTQASITLHAIEDYKNAKADLQEVLAVVDLGNDLIASWDKLAVVIDGAMQHLETVESINFQTEENN